MPDKMTDIMWGMRLAHLLVILILLPILAVAALVSGSEVAVEQPDAE